jgi:nucleoside-diphosphate-sugar epimerase
LTSIIIFTTIVHQVSKQLNRQITTMPPHHVLLLGAHGKIGQLLTPLLLQRSWTVTSVIRSQEQAPAIEKLGAGHPGKLNILVRSISEITSQDQAASILSDVKPDYVAWSAGKHIHTRPVRIALVTVSNLLHRRWWQRRS